MSKIAILIPTYKPDDYIINCFDSIENQTIDKSKFTVYLALNGSDKPYELFLQKLLKRYTFDCNQYFIEQAGVSNARNFLIENSKEDFITFVDDDDQLSPNYLEELLNASSETVLGISNVYNFENSIDEYKENYIGKCFSKLQPITKSKYKSRKYFSSPVAKMIHRKIIDDVRFDVKLAIGEDSLFMAQLSHRVKAVQKTAVTACYYVYEREGSATRQKIDKKKELKRIIYLLKEYSQMFFTFQYGSLFTLSRIIATLMHVRSLFK
jgi:glycosyltransferase involved in cell wall biosynthesis